MQVLFERGPPFVVVGLRPGGRQLQNLYNECRWHALPTR